MSAGFTSDLVAARPGLGKTSLFAPQHGVRNQTVGIFS
jgi:hypothetical protein